MATAGAAAVGPESASSPTSPSSFAASRRAALLLLAAVLVLPLWIVRYPPLVDYPNHLLRSFLLSHLHDPAYRFDQFYRSDWVPSPYLLMDVTLIALQGLMSVETAGRLLLTVSVLAIPLCVFLFLRQASPGNEPLALWSFLLSYEPFFLAGFVNYQLSIAVTFLALAVWLRHLVRPFRAGWILLLVLVTLLYLTHLYGFVVAALLMAGYGLLARRSLRELLYTCVLFVPATAVHLLSRSRGVGLGNIAFHPLDVKLLSLAEPVRGYSRTLDVLTALALSACVAFAGVRNPDLRWNRPWTGVLLGCLALYLVVPDLNGNLADLRLTPFMFVLALAAAGIGRRIRLIIPIAVFVLVLRTAGVAYEFRAVQPEMAVMARSFSVIPAGSRVMPLIESRDEPLHRRFYAHFWAYGVMEQGWFSPFVFHAAGLYPIALKEELYLPRGRGWLHYESPPDWQRVRQDYDYVWAYHVPRFHPALDSIAEPVFTADSLRIYRINKQAAARIRKGELYTPHGNPIDAPTSRRRRSSQRFVN